MGLLPGIQRIVTSFVVLFAAVVPLLAYSSHAMANHDSGCWVSWAPWPRGLLQGPFPDATTALEAATEHEWDRWLGQACYTCPASCIPVYGDTWRKSTITSYRYVEYKPSPFDTRFPRGGVVRGFSFFNDFGEYCAVSPGLGTLYETAFAIDIAHYTIRRYEQECQQRYVVKLSPISGFPESDATLTSVEPGKATNLIARVYDQNGQVVLNAKVKLVVDVQPYSGGHQHDEGRHSNGVNENRVGKLAPYPGTTATVSDHGKVLEGNTGQDSLRFTFTAPAPAGDHRIKASCTDGKNCQPEGADTVWVGVKGLQPIGDNSVYRLIPNAAKDPGHPDNHYLTITAASRLAVLATLYHAKYPNLAVLHLNDASLERGGIFDLNHNWKSPHFEHCRGAAIDIRANGAEGALNITSDNDPMIEEIWKLGGIVGANPKWEVPKKKDPSTGKFVDQWEIRHFHTKLMGQEGLQCP